MCSELFILANTGKGAEVARVVTGCVSAVGVTGKIRRRRPWWLRTESRSPRG